MTRPNWRGYFFDTSEKIVEVFRFKLKNRQNVGKINFDK